MPLIPRYQFSDTEIKKLLQSMVVIIDTREQKNDHIIHYFDTKQASYKVKKLDHGDYGVILPASPDLGIQRDLHFDIAVERKNSIDELAASIKDRNRFENEFYRARKSHFTLMVEDANGYEDIVLHRYRSQYNPLSLLGSLKSFEARYGFSTAFIKRELAGNFIYHHLYYFVRNAIKEEG